MRSTIPLVPSSLRVPVRHVLATVVATTAWAFVASDARAADAGAEESRQHLCVAAFRDAQLLEKGGKLTAAVGTYDACQRQWCPAELLQRCSALQTQLQSKLPTAVFFAKDSKDTDIPRYRVFVNGEEFVGADRGRALSLDPGTHRVRFTLDDPPREHEQMVRVAEGEKNRRVVAVFASDGAKPKPDASVGALPPPLATRSATTISPAAWVFGGVSLLSLGLFGYFAARGYDDEQSLSSRCAPSCPRADVDAIRTKYLVADVSLALGLVSAGFATYYFVSGILAGGSPKPGVSVGVAPVREGWVGGFGGRF